MNTYHHERNAMIKYLPHVVNVLQHINLQLGHLQRVEKIYMQNHPLFRGMGIVRLVLVGRVVQKAFPLHPVTSFGTDADVSRGNELVVLLPGLRDRGGDPDPHLAREPHVVPVAVQGNATQRLLPVEPGYPPRERHRFQDACGYWAQMVWEIFDPVTVVK